MKKSLKKVILTLAAVSALTAAMAVSASAAMTVDTNVTKAEDGTVTGVTLTATAPATAEGEQVTVLVLKDGADTDDGVQEEEIAYIDQKAAEKQTDGTYAAVFSMPLKLTDVAVGDTVKIMSGSETAQRAENESEKITDGEDELICYGDINADGSIKPTDAKKLLYFNAKMYEKAGFDETNIPKTAYLTKKDGVIDDNVNAADAKQLLYYNAKMYEKVQFDYSWLTKVNVQ